MIVSGIEYQKAKDFIKSGQSPYSNLKSLARAIRDLGFPAKKLGHCYYIDVKGAELWIKRRMLDTDKVG